MTKHGIWQRSKATLLSALMVSVSSSAFAQMPPASASSLKVASNATAKPAISKPAAATRITEPGRGASARSLSLGAGKTLVVELPVDARDVIVGNPKVADVVMRTPRRAFIIGGEPGDTNAFFLDAGGNQILNLELKIARDSGAMEEVLSRLTPTANDCASLASAT